MSLKAVLQETEQRYYEAQEKAARDEQEATEFAKRVDLRMRRPDVVVERFDTLHDVLPAGACTYLEALRHTYPDADRVILGPTTTSRTALGGHVLVLKRDQRVSRMPHVVCVKSPFGLTLAARLRNVKYTSSRAFREEHGARVKEFIATLPHEGPALDTHWWAGSEEDAERWPVFFPLKRTHVGFYNGKDNAVYMVVRSHAGAEVLPGVRKIVDESATTAESFVNDPRIKWMQNVAYRNAARLMNGIARFLGFEVPREHDNRSHSGPRRLARYVMARPDIVQYHGTQRMTTLWGEPRALFFHDIIDGGQGAGDKALVHSDIAKGYGMVDVEPPTSADSLPLIPMRTDKIPEEERMPLSIDTREQLAEKISTRMPRSQLLTHHKYRDASCGDKLEPIVVVRS